MLTFTAFVSALMLTLAPPDPVLVEQAAAWQIVGLYQSAQNDSINCMDVAGACKGVHMGEDDALIRAEDWERYARSLERGATISKL
jgi:hypothetical protein